MIKFIKSKSGVARPERRYPHDTPATVMWCDRNTFIVQYLENSWSCYLATIAYLTFKNVTNTVQLQNPIIVGLYSTYIHYTSLRRAHWHDDFTMFCKLHTTQLCRCVCWSSTDNETLLSTTKTSDDVTRPVVNDVKLINKDHRLSTVSRYGTTRRQRTLRARLELGRPSDDSCLTEMPSTRQSSTFTDLPLSVPFIRWVLQSFYRPFLLVTA